MKYETNKNEHAEQRTMHDQFSFASLEKMVACNAYHSGLFAVGIDVTLSCCNQQISQSFFRNHLC